MLLAIGAGVFLALLAAPLGCLMQWRRVSYAGDAMAHGALLGVALALLTGLPVWMMVLGTALVLALALGRMMRGRAAASDALPGVLAQGALAVGLVMLSLAGSAPIDLHALLFGDVLALLPADLALVAVGVMLGGAVLWWQWRRLLNAIISPELMQAEGGDPARAHDLLLVLMALYVMLAVQLVGALLIVALLLVPAAAARPLAHTPEGMARWAMALAALAVVAGLWLSLYLDLPAGPAIVMVALGLFMGTRVKTWV